MKGPMNIVFPVTPSCSFCKLTIGALRRSETIVDAPVQTLSLVQGPGPVTPDAGLPHSLQSACSMHTLCNSRFLSVRRRSRCFQAWNTGQMNTI